MKKLLTTSLLFSTFMQGVVFGEIQFSKNLEEKVGASYLAQNHLIKKRENFDQYRIQDPISRQEVVALGLKLGNVSTHDHTCSNMFQDISKKSPNSWACKNIETAAKRGIISKRKQKFYPEKSISRTEALAILLKSTCQDITPPAHLETYFSSPPEHLQSWQKNILFHSQKIGLISLLDTPLASEVSRGEIFKYAHKLHSLNKCSDIYTLPASRGEKKLFEKRVLHLQSRLADILIKSQDFPTDSYTEKSETQLSLTSNMQGYGKNEIQLNIQQELGVDTQNQNLKSDTTFSYEGKLGSPRGLDYAEVNTSGGIYAKIIDHKIYFRIDLDDIQMGEEIIHLKDIYGNAPQDWISIDVSKNGESLEGLLNIAYIPDFTQKDLHIISDFLRSEPLLRLEGKVKNDGEYFIFHSKPHTLNILRLLKKIHIPHMKEVFRTIQSHKKYTTDILLGLNLHNPYDITGEFSIGKDINIQTFFLENEMSLIADHEKWRIHTSLTSQKNTYKISSTSSGFGLPNIYLQAESSTQNNTSQYLLNLRTKNSQEGFQLQISGEKNRTQEEVVITPPEVSQKIYDLQKSIHNQSQDNAGILQAHMINASVEYFFIEEGVYPKNKKEIRQAIQSYNQNSPLMFHEDMRYFYRSCSQDTYQIRVSLSQKYQGELVDLDPLSIYTFETGNTPTCNNEITWIPLETDRNIFPIIPFTFAPSAREYIYSILRQQASSIAILPLITAGGVIGFDSFTDQTIDNIKKEELYNIQNALLNFYSERGYMPNVSQIPYIFTQFYWREISIPDQNTQFYYARCSDDIFLLKVGLDSQEFIMGNNSLNSCPTPSWQPISSTLELGYIHKKI